MPAPLIAAAAGTAARAAGTQAAAETAATASARTIGTRTARGATPQTAQRIRGGRMSGEAAAQDVANRKQNATSAIQNLFSSKGEELEEGDIQRMLREPPSKPDFPIFISSLALVKDALDSLDLTGFGIILTTITGMGIAIVLIFWMLGKMSGGWWKKGMIKWFWKRFLLVAITELMPFLKIVPATTILVLMAHYKEAKIVKLLNGGLEILHDHGFKKG